MIYVNICLDSHALLLRTIVLLCMYVDIIIAVAL